MDVVNSQPRFSAYTPEHSTDSLIWQNVSSVRGDSLPSSPLLNSSPSLPPNLPVPPVPGHRSSLLSLRSPRLFPSTHQPESTPAFSPTNSANGRRMSGLLTSPNPFIELTAPLSSPTNPYVANMFTSPVQRMASFDSLGDTSWEDHSECDTDGLVQPRPLEDLTSEYARAQAEVFRIEHQIACTSTDFAAYRQRWDEHDQACRTANEDLCLLKERRMYYRVLYKMLRRHLVAEGHHEDVYMGEDMDVDEPQPVHGTQMGQPPLTTMAQRCKQAVVGFRVAERQIAVREGERDYAKKRIVKTERRMARAQAAWNRHRAELANAKLTVTQLQWRLRSVKGGEE